MIKVKGKLEDLSKIEKLKNLEISIKTDHDKDLIVELSKLGIDWDFEDDDNVQNNFDSDSIVEDPDIFLDWNLDFNKLATQLATYWYRIRNKNKITRPIKDEDRIIRNFTLDIAVIKMFLENHYLIGNNFLTTEERQSKEVAIEKITKDIKSKVLGKVKEILNCGTTSVLIKTLFQ